MIKEINKLTEQVIEYLKAQEGFSTEILQHGVQLDVTNPEGETKSYDMYEILLYTLATRKVGSDIELNIHTTESGKKVFAINSKANVDVSNEISKLNAKLRNIKHDTISSVFIGYQVSDSRYPLCVMTLYKNGNWMRYDLAQAELLYAITHELELELDDSTYVYKKLRSLSQTIQNELKELSDK